MSAPLNRLLARSSAFRSAVARRSYATAADSSAAKTLLYIEHRDGKINPGTLNAITAAAALGGELVGLVTGDASSLGKIAEAVKGYASVSAITACLRRALMAFTLLVLPLQHALQIHHQAGSRQGSQRTGGTASAPDCGNGQVRRLYACRSCAHGTWKECPAESCRTVGYGSGKLTLPFRHVKYRG